MFRALKVFFRGSYKILFYYPRLSKYNRKKEKYTLEKRYAFARKLVFIFLKSTRMNLTHEGENFINESKGVLLTPNHQSFLDSLLLIYLSEKPLIFLSKIEVKKMPIVKKILNIIDALFIDRDDLKESARVLMKCRKYLEEGVNVVIFPEGTRSRENNLPIQEFKGGSFRPALQAKKDILAILISGSNDIYSKKGPAIVKVFKPFKYEEFKDLNTIEIAKQVENIIKEEYVNKKEV